MKDAKGHGSESRGGLSKETTDATRRAFTQKYDATGGTMASRDRESKAVSDARGNFGPGSFYDETYGLKGGTPVGAPARPGATFGGQPVESNAHAAATLASGPKSAPVDVHPSMAAGQATGRGFALDAKASTYHPESQSWDIKSRTYQYGGENRKSAISYGLNKIQGEFPDHKEHSVEIREAPGVSSPRHFRTKG